jgi:urease accessory protein
MTGVQSIQNASELIESGWQAQLDLRFAKAHHQAGARTLMQRNEHRGPLRVQRPFYPEGELAHVYILHPPGGVVGGDRLHINLEVMSDAQVLATTPGSGKFYLSAGPRARLEQTLTIKSGASLEWLPQENILFAGARLQACTRIEVEDDGRFIGWDLTSFGRVSRGERFTDGMLFSRLVFKHDQELLLVDNQRVFEQRSLEAAAGLRDQSQQGTLLAFPCDDRALERVREQLAVMDASPWCATTLVDRLLIVRALDYNSEALQQRLRTIWRVLRPLLLHRPAVRPRIWAT